VILATAPSRAEVEQMVQSDPFYREGVASYQIIEFVPSMAAEALAELTVE
jgi:uncharacterized protein YciI